MQTISAANGTGNDFRPTSEGLPDGVNPRLGIVEFGVSISGGRLNFTMHDVVGDFVRFDEQEQRRFLAIEAASKLEFRLSDDVEWTFDFSPKGNDGDLSPLRLKDEDAVGFYRVSRLDQSSKRILVEARKSELGVWTPHAFNIYVLIEQRLGEPLPIRIDPIVDNPPK